MLGEPHHDGSPLYLSDRHPSLGDTVRVRVRIPRAFGAVAAVVVRSNPDHEPQWAAAAPVARLHGWEWWEAPLEVRNPVQTYRFLIEGGDGAVRWLSASGMHDIEPLDVDDFRVTTHPAPPAWLAGAVMYQVFPDRFARSAQADRHAMPEWARPATWTDEPVHVGPDTPLQFYGGDLPGIEERLGHLERLGVNLLYLTPVFPARSNHRYNATSFYRVDELLGGDGALASLVAAAHARGIRVIGDLTANHSGDAHEWFRRAASEPSSPERGFYYWSGPNGSEYACWLGERSLPKFNWQSRELRARFAEGPDSVVARWLRPPYDLDGWRIDVANMTGRHGDVDVNQEVAALIRRTMSEVKPDSVLIAEVTNDAAGDFQGDAWNGAMTYANFTRPVWSWLTRPDSVVRNFFGIPVGRIPHYTGTQLVRSYRRFTAAFPWSTRLGTMNALDTHDTPRFRTHAMPGTVPVALGLSLTLPGVPSLFAGDEFGLTGVDGEHSRTPIPWHLVDAPDIAATIDLHRALVRLRTAHPVLGTGGLRWVHVSDDVVAYVREGEHESILACAARADFDLRLEPDAVAGEPRRLFGVAAAEPGAGPGAGLRLRGRGPSFTVWQLPALELPPFGR